MILYSNASFSMDRKLKHSKSLSLYYNNDETLKTTDQNRSKNEQFKNQQKTLNISFIQPCRFSLSLL